MKKLCLSVLLLIISLHTFAQIQAEADSLLKELDIAISKNEIYLKKKVERVDSLKRQVEKQDSLDKKYHIYAQLFEEYASFQTDSALVYALKKADIAEKQNNLTQKDEASLNVAGIFIITGMYKEASEILSKLSKQNLDYDHSGYYYHLQHTLYGSMADYTILKSDKEHYLEVSDLYRDSLLLTTTSDPITHTMVLADRFVYKGNYKEALDSLLKIYPTQTTENRLMGYLAYAIADIYHKMGNTQKEKYFLTLSAISDIKSSVKENISLRKLAILLFEEGQTKRAYTYMRLSLDDATFCNARQRTLQISEVLPIIETAYQIEVEKQKKEITIVLIAISILSLILIILIVCIRWQMKKTSTTKKELSRTNSQLSILNIELRDLNDKLSNSNSQLQDTNDKLFITNQELKKSDFVKEVYLGKFIDMCSVYIDKLDSYRKGLNKIAMNEKVEDLYKALKSSQFIEEELKDFYINFDDTFLRIFPTFIDEFNLLFSEHDKWEPKAGELLTTELRIFALIRLGINDSSKIASFLRYSITTIYTYRSKLRSKSLYKDDFEERIMKIGIKQ